MKFKLSKVKWFGAIISLLTSVMSFSIGFGIWSINGTNSEGTSGNIQVENISVDPINVNCFTKPSVTGFAFSEYGFLQSDNSFATTSTTISGSAQFKAASAKQAILSLNTNSSFSLTISLSGYASNTATTIGADLDITSLTITSGLTVASSGLVVTSGDNLSISKQFDISNVNTSSDAITFSFSMTVSYKGSSFSTFYSTYSASGAGFKVSLDAGESQ